MRKIVFILLSIIMLSCNKESEPNRQEFLELFKRERNIPQDISIERISLGKDFEVVAGKKDFELYLYKIKDKKIIASHKESIPKEVKKGEKIYSVKGFTPNISQLKDDGFVWIDVKRDWAEQGSTSVNPYYILFSFVLHKDIFVKIDNKSYDWNGDILDIRSWNNSNFLVQVTGNSDRDFYIYNDKWQFLFKAKSKSLINPDKIYALNQEEAIEFGNEKHLFKRINIKDNNIVWQIDSEKIFPAKRVFLSRVTQVNKAENIWTFIVNYTLQYEDNEKQEQFEEGTKTIKIDINNGKIIE
ncbi:hypothetical protein [Capnocytophaga stomatis]|uniref:hypothetical protein n=1 Tax=Capnocytophaga stomatis TaxID=1848904 RepID=UPI0019510E52|nr:hypothetical protein [Capnocytophaga stomatis]